MTLDRIASLLFVPGNQPARFDKALASGADGIILDLEDAVSVVDKDKARDDVFRWLRETGAAKRPPGAALHGLRLNAQQSPFFAADEAALCQSLHAQCGPDLIVLPKVESPEEVSACLDKWAKCSAALPLVLALIETAVGVEHVERIARHPGVAGLGFGAADLSADMGCDMSWEALIYARGRVAHAAALGRVALLDVPHLDLNDEEGLRAQALRAKAMGFTGKFAIHPRQVGPTRECFTPSESQVASARRIVEAAARGQGQVCVVDGRMVDEPVVQSARRILARAGL